MPWRTKLPPFGSPQRGRGGAWRRAALAAGLLAASVPLAAAQVTVLMSRDLPIYRTAVDSIKKELSGNKVSEFILEGKDEKSVLRDIEKSNPDVVIPIGGEALKAAAGGVAEKPVIFSMVANPEKSYDASKGNIAGVSLNLDYDIFFANLKELLPNVQVVGALHGADSAADIEAARKGAQRNGLKLEARPAASDRDVPAAFRGVVDGVQAWWLYPEVSLLTEESVQFVSVETTKRGIPIISPAPKFQNVALLVILPRFAGTFEQTSQMVKRIIQNGDAPGTLGVERTRQMDIVLNAKVAKAFNIAIAPAAQKKLVTKVVEQ